MHVVRIKDGKASYCNRFVDTLQLQQAKLAGHPVGIKVRQISNPQLWPAVSQMHAWILLCHAQIFCLSAYNADRPGSMPVVLSNILQRAAASYVVPSSFCSLQKGGRKPHLGCEVR